MTTKKMMKQRNEVQYREFGVDSNDIDLSSRTVRVVFSSDAPITRFGFTEILDHNPKSVRLGRLADSGPVLVDHNPTDHVGVIESLSLEDNKGKAVLRFGRSARAQEIFNDVADRIRTKLSVGYVIHEEKQDRVNGVDVYTVTDWEPMEVSFVSIPADVNAQVGREFNQEATTMVDETKQGDAPAEPEMKVETRAAAPEVADREDGAKAERKRAADILELAKELNAEDIAPQAIALGHTLDQFRAIATAIVRKPTQSAPVESQRVEMEYQHAGRLRAYKPENYGGGLREAHEQAYRAGKWAQATIFGNESAARWCRDYGVQLSQRVLTGMGAGQSVLIPDELALPIISLREQYGLARRVCYVHPMATDTTSVPRDAGDVTAYFVGREQAPTPNDPAFDNINLTAKNVAAESRISNDYAEDSVINLADHVAEKHARAFAIKEDTCLFNGDGTSTYGGIVGLRTALLGLAGAVDAASGNDTFSEITTIDLRNVMATLPDLPGINPSWFTSKAGQNRMFGRLTDAAGGNTKRDLATSMPEQYGGYGILTSPAMPTTSGDLSDVVMAIFGDLRMGVVFGDRRGMTMMVDPYSLSSYQQTKIIGSERFDINCHGVGDASNPGPIVGLVGE